jgi:hypothetical protein
VEVKYGKNAAKIRKKAAKIRKKCHENPAKIQIPEKNGGMSP